MFTSCKLLLLIVFSLTPLFAMGQLPVYQKASGQRLFIKNKTLQANVDIAVVSSSSERMVIEIKMNSQVGLTAVSLVQQFHLVYESGKLKIEAGYIKSPQFEKKVYRLSKEYLTGYGGVQLDSFLFGSLKSAKFVYRGEANVKLSESKKIKAKYFELEENGQKVEFWISDKIKPFGIVAIKSKSKKSDQNYIVGHKDLITGYIPKIDPSKAVEMTEKIKAFLPRPKKRTSIFLP